MNEWKKFWLRLTPCMIESSYNRQLQRLFYNYFILHTIFFYGSSLKEISCPLIYFKKNINSKNVKLHQIMKKTKIRKKIRVKTGRWKIYKKPNSTIMMSNIQIIKALFEQTWRVLSYLYFFQIMKFTSIQKAKIFFVHNNECLLLTFLFFYPLCKCFYTKIVIIIQEFRC